MTSNHIKSIIPQKAVPCTQKVGTLQTKRLKAPVWPAGLAKRQCRTSVPSRWQRAVLARHLPSNEQCREQSAKFQVENSAQRSPVGNPGCQFGDSPIGCTHIRQEQSARSTPRTVRETIGLKTQRIRQRCILKRQL